MASYDYDPFGGQRGPSGGPANPMRFTGEYLDPTGLYHLRARQYEASLGRFLSTDPLVPALTDSSVSAYLYAGGRPTAAADPSGLRYELSMGEDLFRNPVAVWWAGAPQFGSFLWQHRGEVAGVIAFGACVVSTLGTCAVFATIAFGIRAQRSYEQAGGFNARFAKSLAVDAFTSYALLAGSLAANLLEAETLVAELVAKSIANAPSLLCSLNPQCGQLHR